METKELSAIHEWLQEFKDVESTISVSVNKKNPILSTYHIHVYFRPTSGDHASGDTLQELQENLAKTIDKRKMNDLELLKKLKDEYEKPTTQHGVV